MTEDKQRKSKDPEQRPAVAGAVAGLGGRLSGRLGSLVQRSGGLVDRLAGSVKEVARSSLLRQALDARERGNLPAAFHLLREEQGNRPEDVDTASAFWDVAVEYGRAAQAVDAVAFLIRKHAAAGAIELAAQYWTELSAQQPDSLVDAATLARIAAHLFEAQRGGPAGADSRPEDETLVAERERRRRALGQALRGIVDERNHGLSTGIALHAVELARELEPAVALAASRFALASGQIHEAKRARLEALVADLDPSAPRPATQAASEAAARPESAVASDPAAPPEPTAASEPAAPPEPSSDPATASAEHPARNHPLRTESPPHTPLSDDELEALKARLPPSRPSTPPPAPVPLVVPVAAPCFGGLKVSDLRPVALEPDGLVLEGPDAARTRVDYGSIQALAVAEVGGLGGQPVVLIDLVLNWRSREEGPLEVVRLRGDGFDAGELMAGEGGAALQALLASLLERSAAIPLPDPDSALGLVVPSFASLADYERNVLQTEA